ncbi:hypothetical protein [Cyanobium sp. ATX 6A2]|uniref:hypothetical protein n=1 Tax=Cyanobium sp. ATX 6A2 TaxID=2823700 RepID=UPI0020CF4966|nr:hypothetical protein [Cyanobium sp. ATX 6A2]
MTIAAWPASSAGSLARCRIQPLPEHFKLLRRQLQFLFDLKLRLTLRIALHPQLHQLPLQPRYRSQPLSVEPATPSSAATAAGLCPCSRQSRIACSC